MSDNFAVGSNLVQEPLETKKSYFRNLSLSQKDLAELAVQKVEVARYSKSSSSEKAKKRAEWASWRASQSSVVPTTAARPKQSEMPLRKESAVKEKSSREEEPGLKRSSSLDSSASKGTWKQKHELRDAKISRPPTAIAIAQEIHFRV